MRALWKDVRQDGCPQPAFEERRRGGVRKSLRRAGGRDGDDTAYGKLKWWGDSQGRGGLGWWSWTGSSRIAGKGASASFSSFAFVFFFGCLILIYWLFLPSCVDYLRAGLDFAFCIEYLNSNYENVLSHNNFKLKYKDPGFWGCMLFFATGMKLWKELNTFQLWSFIFN